MCAAVVSHSPAGMTVSFQILSLFVRAGHSKLSEILTTHLGSVMYLIMHAFKSHNEVSWCDLRAVWSSVVSHRLPRTRYALDCVGVFPCSYRPVIGCRVNACCLRLFQHECDGLSVMIGIGSFFADVHAFRNHMKLVLHLRQLLWHAPAFAVCVIGCSRVYVAESSR
jgi:hypothetical protein